MQAQKTKLPQRAAKAHLASNGWSYRTAAKELGVCYQHLSDVLNGRRPSARLISKIMILGKKEVAA